MNKDLEIVKALIMEMNATYKKSGLKHPEKADLNKDKKISPYEKKRGKAIEKNLKKEVYVEIPQSADELPQHDGLYYVGGFIDIDGSPWVSKAEAEQILNSLRENHEGQDHEVSMANNSLDSILWAANELKKHLGDQERDIPAWIQDHITNAENYILQAAKNFHDYGQEQPEMPNDMSLEEMIKKVGSKYNVYSKKGKKLGSHPSKKKAQKQMAAIEISKQGK